MRVAQAGYFGAGISLPGLPSQRIHCRTIKNNQKIKLQPYPTVRQQRCSAPCHRRLQNVACPSQQANKRTRTGLSGVRVAALQPAVVDSWYLSKPPSTHISQPVKSRHVKSGGETDGVYIATVCSWFWHKFFREWPRSRALDNCTLMENSWWS